MQKTNLNDWKIVRKDPPTPYLTHSIYESDNFDYAFYFSPIEEWSLMKYCTKLQIYKDKSAPRLIYASKSVWFLFDPPDYIYDWTFEKLVCFRRLIDNGNNRYSYPFIIIDLEKLLCVSLQDNIETLSKKSDKTITVTFDQPVEGIQEKSRDIELAKMQWIPLKRLS